MLGYVILFIFAVDGRLAAVYELKVWAGCSSHMGKHCVATIDSDKDMPMIHFHKVNKG